MVTAEEVVRSLPVLLREHPALRMELFGILSEEFVGKSEFYEYMKKSDERFESLLQELRVFRADTNRRFEEVNWRFEEVNWRFEAVDKRFDKVDSNIENLKDWVGTVVGGTGEEEVGAVQRSYLLVLWVEVPPLQFSVGNVVIPDSRWSDPMAESSEVKAFYREASNQKGRSESERNRRRNTRYCSCQVSSASRRWLLSLLEETEGCTRGSYRRTEGGNSGENSRESSEGLRTSQDDPRTTKTVPITEEGNGKEVCRLADEVDKRRSRDDDKPGGARTSGFRRDSGYTSSRLSAGIGMLTQPKSQSVGQTCSFETDSPGSDEVCDRCTGKGSLRA